MCASSFNADSVAPGETYAQVVSFSLTLSGTVDTFDAESFKASLASTLGMEITAADITLDVTSASVVVAASR